MSLSPETAREAERIDLALLVLDPHYGNIEGWARDSDYVLCTEHDDDPTHANCAGQWVDHDDNPVEIYGCYVAAKEAESAALEAEYEADPEGKAAEKARADLINAVLFDDHVTLDDLTVEVAIEQVRIVLSHPLFASKRNPLDKTGMTCVYFSQDPKDDQNARCGIGQWGHWFPGVPDEKAVGIEGGVETYLIDTDFWNGIENGHSEVIAAALQNIQGELDGDLNGNERVGRIWGEHNSA